MNLTGLKRRARSSGAVPEPPVVAAPDKNSYGQILKSSALIGGSALINVAIKIVRTKAMAVLLGPTGFGLMSLYTSVADLARNMAEMGINSSGVRQIAEAAGSGDSERIARTATVLRRISVLLGLLGASLLILFSSQISTLTFGGNENAGSVALLSLVVLFGCIAGGQEALIQGMRRVADLAKMSVLGAFFGTSIAIPLVYFFGEQGVVPSLVGVAAMGILTAWWFSRKIQVERLALTILQMGEEAASLLKLGFAFMASALMMTGSAYVVRLILSREVGLEAAGFYQAAWTLGGLYVGFILQAMGADFYPRLTGVAADNAASNRIVNEQARVSLLLAGPGVIATLTFAPLVIALFYSVEFDAAVEILRWICLGMALRVIIWPIGFIILAKGAQNLFFWTELAWTAANIGLTWVCVKAFGVNGAGIAFFGSYVVHGILVYPIVRSLSGFGWSDANLRIGLLFISLIVIVFCCFYVLPPFWAYSVGTSVVILTSVYSLRSLVALVGEDRLPKRIRRLLSAFVPRIRASDPE